MSRVETRQRLKRLAELHRKAPTKLISARPNMAPKSSPRTYRQAKALYNTLDYNIWRQNVYKRDGFTCQLCGTKGDLEAHHIRPKYKHPELTLVEDNGITLCKVCHQDRVTRHEQRFIYIFDRIVALNKQEIKRARL